MKVTIVQLVISTPVQEEITTASIADHLRANADIAYERARAITNLETMGWTLLRRPSIVQTDTDYQDFIAYWRKDFDVTPPPADVIACGASPDVELCDACIDAYRHGIEPGGTACDDREGHQALRDMRAAGAFEDLNFSLLWGYRDGAPDAQDDLSSPNHEWGSEGPSRTD